MSFVIKIINVYNIEKYIFIRFPMISKVVLRNTLSSCGYNLSNTVEKLQNNPNQKYLKRKRKSLGDNFQAPDNIEYLKEVKI